MNAKQNLIVMIGVFLIALTIWQHWKGEVAAVLFNGSKSSTAKNGDVTNPLTGQARNGSGYNAYAPGTGPAPWSNQFYYTDPNAPGALTGNLLS